MLSVFRTNQSIINIFLLIYAFLLRIPSFFIGEDCDKNTSGILSQWLFDQIDTSGLIPNILALFLLFFQAILLNGIVSTYRMANETTLFPGLIYILLASSFPEFLCLSPMLIANTFLLFTYRAIYSTNKIASIADKLYNAGFWIGLATLFHFPMILFLLLVFIGFNIVRSLKLNDYFIIISGFITPLIILSGFYIWVGNLSELYYIQFVASWQFYNFNIAIDWQFYFKIGFFVILLIVSIMSYESYIYKKIILAKKYINVLYWGLLIGIMTLFFHNKTSTSQLLLLTIPFGVFLHYNFLSLKKPIAELLHFVLFIATLLFHLKPYIS